MSEQAHAFALAQHYVDVGQPQRALDALRAADERALEDTDFWRLRGWALHDLESFDEASDTAREGLKRDPHSFALLHLLAVTEAELDNLAEAERALLAALELDPENPYLLGTYARLLARGGQLDKAERVAAEAARSSPDDPAVAQLRGLLAFLRGRNRDAERFSEEALAYDPEDAAAHALRGASIAHRDLRGARRAYETAIRDDPSDRYIGEAVRQTRIATHPLMWPMLLIHRLGVAGSWVAAMVTIFGLRGLGYDTAAGVATAVWLALVAYSWLAAPAIERWLRSRGP